MHLSTKNQNETKEISGGIYPPLLILIVFSDDRLTAPFHGQLSISFGTPSIRGCGLCRGFFLFQQLRTNTLFIKDTIYNDQDDVCPEPSRRICRTDAYISPQSCENKRRKHSHDQFGQPRKHGDRREPHPLDPVPVQINQSQE